MDLEGAVAVNKKHEPLGFTIYCDLIELSIETPAKAVEEQAMDWFVDEFVRIGMRTVKDFDYPAVIVHHHHRTIESLRYEIGIYSSSVPDFLLFFPPSTRVFISILIALSRLSMLGS